MFMAACVGEESGRLVTPSRSAGHVGSDFVRIVEPRDGRFVHAGQAFLIRVEQYIRSGPVQGRGQVQLSAEGSDWRDLGRAFPWSRQGAEFATFAVIGSAGRFRLRVLIFAEERDPLFQTDPVQVTSLGPMRSVATWSPAAFGGRLRGPPPR
jgi:hypothetical protein